MAGVSPAVWTEPARKADADTQEEAEAVGEGLRPVAFGALVRHACSPAATSPFLQPGSVRQ